MSERATHRVVRMEGRDPAERHRAATPLELLFDLTFVIAFGVAADELAYQVAHHHTPEGVAGFAFAIFAVTWAWIFWTWFASAYDTDDWVFRLLTMVQMVGVLVLALGLPAMFESLVEGDHVDNGVMVVGYVIMRVPMLAQWYRASRQDPARGDIARLMMVSIVASQAVWCFVAIARLSVGWFVAVAAVAIALELSGPVLAERRRTGTPWHPHHAAERFGLLVIITLGEGLLGTVFALQVLIEDGWTSDIVLLGLAGTTLTFGLWWTYFVVPFAPLLEAHRERGVAWGYAHLPLLGGLVAVGAGLHVAAYHLGDEYDVGPVASVVSVALPVAVYLVCLYGGYALMARSFSTVYAGMLAGSAVVLLAGVGLAAAGVDVVWCLLVLALAPWVHVVVYERWAHTQVERQLAAAVGGTRSD